MLSVTGIAEAASARVWGAAHTELDGLCHLLLNDVGQLESVLLDKLATQGIRASRALVKRFSPHGVTLVLVGAEVRIVLHTWPEHGQATLDVRGLVYGVERATKQLSLALYAARERKATVSSRPA